MQIVGFLVHRLIWLFQFEQYNSSLKGTQLLTVPISSLRDQLEEEVSFGYQIIQANEFGLNFMKPRCERS